MPFQRAEGAIAIGSTYCATLDEIRAVWASISGEPAITLRCLAQQTGIKKTKVRHILHFLEKAGYMSHKAHHTGRQVRIPLIWA